MLFKAVKYSSVLSVDIVKMICGCRFCQGKDMRKDVEHYKIWLIGENGQETRDEYYLNIDTKSEFIELVRKD